MNTDEQRIAIAEACGTRQEGRWWCPACEREISPQMVRCNETHDGCGATCKWTELSPDYTRDLNAMHEAEKTLTDDQWDDYEACLNSQTHSFFHDRHLIHATAAQRAEAFLKCIGKWKD